MQNKTRLLILPYKNVQNGPTPESLKLLRKTEYAINTDRREGVMKRILGAQEIMELESGLK